MSFWLTVLASVVAGIILLIILAVGFEIDHRRKRW